MRENSTSRVIRNFGRVRDAVEIPDLVAIQRKSYDTFLQRDVAPTKRKDAGLEALFRETFPIESYDKKMVMEYQRLSFTNQNKEMVAKVDLWIARAERHTARKTGKYTSIELPHPWTDEELEKVDEEVLNEEIRGANIRYWEDVEIGEELPSLVKGPFGLTDMVAYCVGAAPVTIAAHGTQLKLYKKHPAWGFRDPLTYGWEPVYGVHYNKAAANAAGLPYPYDVGVQRHSWLINFITNWIGDEGWLKENYAEYRKFVYYSDVIWFNGKVVEKHIDNGEYCVDIETSAINQRNENVMPGHSRVVFPSRNNGTRPLDSRLRK